jgi:hypothetical protein
MRSLIRLNLLDLVKSGLGVLDLVAMHLKDLGERKVDDLEPVGKIVGWVCVLMVAYLRALNKELGIKYCATLLIKISSVKLV